MSDYDRISKAISFLTQHVTEQPTLDALAEHLHLSPFHCQRLFTRWAGISPKRFLQVLTLELGKNLLDQSFSVLDASDEAGLSSSSRLYDHFVQLEAVTPGEYRSKGERLEIEYGLSETPFGTLFLAATPRGICRAAFIAAEEFTQSISELARQWPAATLKENKARIKTLTNQIFIPGQCKAKKLKIHVQGTNFQISIWRALLNIPCGKATTYSHIAQCAGRPGAARAAGNAIGANPVAVLIPCHRVIQQSGALGGYRWGPERKLAIQAWEKFRDPAR